MKYDSPYNCVVLLGPTAVGKTSLGVKIADHFGWHVISADSRQVYRGLDLGSGKDLADYTVNGRQIPYHLIDITDLGSEYNVFHYQQDFYKVFRELEAEGSMPFVVGGTGMYVDAVIRGYDFVPVPENAALRAELAEKSLEELDSMLLSLKPVLHNQSDLLLRERVVRAIEIELFMKSDECRKAREKMLPRPDIKPLVIGVTLPRTRMHENIRVRLRERFEQGMIMEVKNLHDSGYSWERLEKLGLEYRFCSEFLQGKYKSRGEMEEKLFIAIRQFAKRQETWFRMMEKKGVEIHWLGQGSKAERIEEAVKMISDLKMR